MFAWFVSNEKLSQAISFPITSRVNFFPHSQRKTNLLQLPGVVGAFWGVFIFKEVQVNESK